MDVPILADQLELIFKLHPVSTGSGLKELPGAMNDRDGERGGESMLIVRLDD